MTSGCYHVVIILGIAVVAIAVTRWLMEGARGGRAVIAAALGVLLGMAAILPVLAMNQVAIRNGGLANDGRLAVDLYGVSWRLVEPVLLRSFPWLRPICRIGTPFYFAGWVSPAAAPH